DNRSHTTGISDAIDNVLYKLLGKHIEELSTMEQREIKYIIEEVTK
ncbi:unnamed protein product, partial [marine sediment metagenome]